MTSDLGRARRHGTATVAAGGRSIGVHVPARSFRPRRRALSPGRAAAFAAAAPKVLVEPAHCSDLAALFPEHRDVTLDIGFGGGEALVELAATRPDEAVLGVEVHTPGVARVVTAAADHGWSHVRVVQGDVLDVVAVVPPASLAGVRVWFPDPWPKQRQRHRRLLQAPFLGHLVHRLRQGGELHVATDVDDYARAVGALIAQDVRLAGGVVDRPAWRPVTRFERRALDAGRAPIDLIARRIG